MASPKTPPPPRVARPRPTSTAARSVTSAPRSGMSSAAPPAVARVDENLDVTYAHVRRDLRRIFVLAILLLAGIYGSQFV